MGELIEGPVGYNYIEDIGSGWVLWKNQGLKPVGSFMIKNALIEFGHDPLHNKVKIRRLGYSKGEYKEADIKRIAEMTKNCAFCKIGKSLQNINLNNNELINYINTNYTKFEVKSMVTMTDWLDQLTKMPDINKDVIPQIFSRLLNLGVSIAIPNDIIRYLGFNLAGGLTGLILNEFLMENGRLKDEFRIFFGNLLSSGIPNLDIEKIGRDFQEIMGAARFGNPLDFLKMAFQSPIEQVQNAITNLTRQIGFGGGVQNFQAPGRGARRPEFPIPFGQQVATSGFKLPSRSPLLVPGLPPQITRDSEFNPQVSEVAGFRVIKSVVR
jgi:hypothetical protein